MRKKKVITKQTEEDKKYYVDPNPDPAGFDRTIGKLTEAGFAVFREDGVLMVEAHGREISEVRDEIGKIIDSCGFNGSWGVRKYRKKN